MTPDGWKKVGTLFHAALEVPAGQQRQWLEGACPDDPEVLAEVVSLLGSDAAGGFGFLEKQLEPAVSSLLRSRGGAEIPSRVGPYRLVRELGRGGMGTVYLAERDDDEYQTQVAIKLVSRGMDTDLILTRFYRERQTLARLQHPNIARLLDGGTTPEGHPYIVMEFVDGAKITEFCREENSNIVQRLTLFLDVCKAVDYAHRHFVVHRDLKPGNILVDKSGQVKLLDFGICKLLQASPAQPEDTVSTGGMLTPDYASPEQIRGEPITVASDVYSLAAVLYELLSGARPHKIEEYTLRGMERGICETEVVAPSLACENRAVARQLSGDLDNIVLFGLNKDPLRRYQSIDHFAEDIRRYLTHQPVRARPDAVAYRVGKFLRRRIGLVAALAAVAIALLVGAFLAVRSARIANGHLAVVRQLSNTLVFDVYDAVKYLPGSTKARELIVRKGLQNLEGLTRSATEDVKGSLELAGAYRRIGDVQGDVVNANLGKTADAMSSYQRALGLLEVVLKEEAGNREAIVEKIVVHRRMANIQQSQQEMPQALNSLRQAEGLAESLVARFPQDKDALLTLGEVYTSSSNASFRNSEFEVARKGYQRVMTLLSGYQQAHPADRDFQVALATAYSGTGQCDVRIGRLREALESYRQAVAMREAHLKLEPTNVLSQRALIISYATLGDVLGSPDAANLGDPSGAIHAYGQMVALARRVYEADPSDQRARIDMAMALMRAGSMMPREEVRERVRVLREALQLHQEVARIDSGNISNRTSMVANHVSLGESLEMTGDGPGAVRSYREGLRLAESMLPNGSNSLVAMVVTLYRHVGIVAAKRGDRVESLAMVQRVLQVTDGEGAAAKKRSAEFKRLLAARGASIAGQIHGKLAQGRGTGAAERAEARRWLETGIQQYRALEKLPTFSNLYRRELRETEQTLEALQ